MSNTSKARRATIPFGDMSLNVYQMPNGKYKFAGRNVTAAIDEPNNSLIRTMGVKSLKDLPHADPSLIQVKAETGESFDAVDMEDVAEYWGRRALAGNPRAAAILIACTMEGLEQRADKAFGVVRTDEERNARLKTRIDRIAARLGWTDVIKRDQEDRGIYLTDIGAREFANLTMMVNRRLFGVSNFDSDRDNMNIDQQLDITAFERLLMRKYREGMDLCGVIYDCLDFYQSVEH